MKEYQILEREGQPNKLGEIHDFGIGDLSSG
jgi:hypothetical protein